MTIGERIKAARNKAGSTQVELGEKIGRNYQTIVNLENGKRSPKYEMLEKIAAALGVSVGELMGESDEISSKTDKSRKENLVDKLEDVFEDLYQRADPGMELDKLVAIGSAMANIADTIARLEKA